MNIVKISRCLMIFVGVSGCFSVLFSAWLAHAGQSLAIVEQTRLDTAVNFQLIHTLALLATLVWMSRQSSKILLSANLCFCIGIICFSGSLYVKTFLSLSYIGNFAPFGGVLLALAWLQLAFIGKSKL